MIIPKRRELSEIYKALMESIQYKKYVVDPNIVVLEIGDIVSPETIIGFSMENGQPVPAGMRGQVVQIMINPANDSLMTLAISKNIT